uniref:hypothetical protein n=1 Tax=Tessaracoccus bendigoensis TaxID=72764 RepID=UPI001FE715C7|nr:hypothetical protein [Tessaracoccus bendigoensis]
MVACAVGVLTGEFASAIAFGGVDEADGHSVSCEGAAELADLASRRTQLGGEQQKLLQGHYAGAIPLDLLE